jgi:methylthioribose-1-phosphate isomerase
MSLRKKQQLKVGHLDFYKQRTIEFVRKTNSVRMIDQTLLPTEFRFENCKTVKELVRAIETMQVRGAPAIGVAGAMGIALSFWLNRDAKDEQFLTRVKKDAEYIKSARPTAVNLSWGVDRTLSFLKTRLSKLSTDRITVYEELLDFVDDLADRDVEANKMLSEEGAALIPNGASVLTHCK